MKQLTVVARHNGHMPRPVRGAWVETACSQVIVSSLERSRAPYGARGLKLPWRG